MVLNVAYSGDDSYPYIFGFTQTFWILTMCFSASKNIHFVFQLLQLATVISSLQFHLRQAHKGRRGRQPCYPSAWTQTANQESMSSRAFLSTSPPRPSARFASLWQSPWWVCALIRGFCGSLHGAEEIYSSKKGETAFPWIPRMPWIIP